MIAIDTSALIAIVASELEASQFVQTILLADEALVAAPTVFEFLMVARGVRQIASEAAAARVLALPRIRIVAWDGPLVALAHTAFLKFGKGRHPAKLNFGDCMSYALAKSLDAPLLYRGGDFALTDIRSAA